MIDRTEALRFHAQMIQELARQLSDEPMPRKRQKGVFKIMMTTCNTIIAWSTFIKAKVEALEHDIEDLTQANKLLEQRLGQIKAEQDAEVYEGEN